jgi:hypothetical protein
LIAIKNFEFKKFKKSIHNGSKIVHKNVTNLMVKTVSELESCVKNYRENLKNGGFACMRQVAGGEGGKLF